MQSEHKQPEQDLYGNMILCVFKIQPTGDTQHLYRIITTYFDEFCCQVSSKCWSATTAELPSRTPVDDTTESLFEVKHIWRTLHTLANTLTRTPLL